MTTQTQIARAALERMASELEDTAAALRAVLAGTAEDWHLHTVDEHMTSDRYGLRYTGFDDARCPLLRCDGLDARRGRPRRGLLPLLHGVSRQARGSASAPPQSPQKGQKGDPVTITIKTTPEGADTLTDALATYAEHFPEFAPTVEALLRELLKVLAP